ncbi:class I SAM-dependent methyltransferase [Acetobacter fabarum]|jgi:SAM-dependent MidA family methyltransferase|uniref:Methyltransferase n=2 Tax=Acetobacter fabarum TaxID=483199 RepID=A0A269XYN7_9PROT|nr:MULTISPECIES: SAM-dependent methyltransferase [Acetobacter]MCH4141640.1 SAM-dependent methyltransferase [Acetobacter fabarum]MCI1298005.1 SAM-dependent methyltransferase [Acetobacter fabarum]MCI1420107.1 SAM-dependent methyltransferase [Acetobacter fabarum]MCI1446869.1 SAM-dependent methyltransferase [Acetobacter fabarum]MCI1515031.1 SAM-dependent methyltransferase [Acetobacter fabarum]
MAPHIYHAERLDHFMARVNAQYYAETPFLSDFITAPEISQVFGELLGAWAITVWQGMGSPAKIILAEAGPGRGTLMADALRVITRQAPAMAQALSVHLVETSPRLRQVQAEILQPYTQPVWHKHVEDIPASPMILLANEFLDALPVRQFIQTSTGWHEHYVANKTLELIACPPPTLPDSRVLEPNTVVEVCEQAQHIVRGLAHRFTHSPGVALFIDYGHNTSSTGDSLQALRHARPTHPLQAEEGEADLTTHVDFTALLAVARKGEAATYGTEDQGDFLQHLGIMERTEQLARNAAPQDAAMLRSAANRLVAPDKMGHLFKVMALASPSLPTPPGFTKGPVA